MSSSPVFYTPSFFRRKTLRGNPRSYRDDNGTFWKTERVAESCLLNFPSSYWNYFEKSLQSEKKSSKSASLAWLCFTSREGSFPGGAYGKELTVNAGDKRDAGSIPGSGRSPWGGHGNTLQYSCWGNPMDREAWPALDHRVAKSWTWLKRLSTDWGHDSIWELSKGMQLMNSMPGSISSLLGKWAIEYYLSLGQTLQCQNLSAWEIYLWTRGQNQTQKG